MLVFLILAGGTGTRFWPISKKDKPKQFLSMFSDKPLLIKTIDRIKEIVDKNRIFISTNSDLKKNIKKILPDIDDSRLIVEPVVKDTCLAITYSSLIISKIYNNPTICVLPADHLIENENEFKSAILEGYENSQNKIITFGVKPDKISTDYGYIKSFSNLNTITKVLEFKENPDYDTAKEYISEKRYLWNSGILIFQYKFFLEELKIYYKELYDVIDELDKLESINDIYDKGVKLFLNLNKISIDYAILEKTNKLYVIEVGFKWTDVGTYLFLEEFLPKDENNNVIKNTKVYEIDSKNNIIISEENTNTNVNLLGVENMVISLTRENVLIINKKDIHKIKDLIKKVEL